MDRLAPATRHDRTWSWPTGEHSGGPLPCRYPNASLQRSRLRVPCDGNRVFHHRRIVMKVVYLISWVCLLGTPALTAAQEVRIEKDIAYLGTDRAEKLDLYAPAKVEKGQLFPGIVIIHGGGFTGGD